MKANKREKLNARRKALEDAQSKKVTLDKREKLNARRKALEDAQSKKVTLDNVVKAILNATKSRCWLNKGLPRGENLHD
jgi:uncharacterized protein YoxC